MTYGNAPRTQTEWDAKRAEQKAKAEKSWAKAQKDAKAKLKALRKGQEPVVEAPVEEVVDESEEVKPYGEWTNAELSAELTARDLPHSGSKDELVARLEESDKSEETA